MVKRNQVRSDILDFWKVSDLEKVVLYILKFNSVKGGGGQKDDYGYS